MYPVAIPADPFLWEKGHLSAGGRTGESDGDPSCQHRWTLLMTSMIGNKDRRESDRRRRFPFPCLDREDISLLPQSLNLDLDHDIQEKGASVGNEGSISRY